MKFLSLGIVLYRMRVRNTKLPYLWLLLPPLMRILPFVLVLAAVSESQKAIGYVAIYFSFASASVYVRRGFRINAIFPKRVPIWIADSMDLRSAARTFALTSAFENLPAAFIVAIGLGLATSTPMLVIKVLTLLIVLIISILWIGYRILPYLIVKNESIGDVKQSIRYIFLGLSSLLIVVFKVSAGIPDIVFLLAPFGHVPLLINAFYGHNQSLYLSMANLFIYVPLLALVTRKYSWYEIRDAQDKNIDEELEEL